MNATKLDELSIDDFDDVSEDHTVDIRSGVIGLDADAAAPTRLARGTDCLLCSLAGSPADHDDHDRLSLHSVCNAQLHAALTVVADLLGVIDCKAHMFQPAQDAIWRAKRLLEEHGVARAAKVTP